MNGTSGQPENKREDVERLSSEETLFLRIASAAEGLVLAAILSVILPSIFKKRKRTSFYPRLAIAYSLIVLIIIIRFYDFLETNIFQKMSRDHKIRFLLYGLATLEAMFDMCLVALATEICLELCSTVLPEKRLWMLFVAITAGIPSSFFVIILSIWESSAGFGGVVATALVESVLPGLALLVLTGLVAYQARRKKLALTEDSIARIKVVLLMNGFSLMEMLCNLIFYSLGTAVIMDDMIDSILKLGLCGCYILVQPDHPASLHLLSCLHTAEVGLGPVSSVQSAILQEGGERDRPANMVNMRSSRQ